MLLEDMRAFLPQACGQYFPLFLPASLNPSISGPSFSHLLSGGKAEKTPALASPAHPRSTAPHRALPPPALYRNRGTRPVSPPGPDHVAGEEGTRGDVGISCRFSLRLRNEQQRPALQLSSGRAWDLGGRRALCPTRGSRSSIFSLTLCTQGFHDFKILSSTLGSMQM